MLISVDIKGIHDHIPILHREQAVIQELIECLCVWREKATLDGSADMGRIEQLLQIVRNQEQSIQRRIMLLNDAADKFINAKDAANKILGDTLDATNALRAL